jgi:hypothetical protein
MLQSYDKGMVNGKANLVEHLRVIQMGMAHCFLVQIIKDPDN